MNKRESCPWIQLNPAQIVILIYPVLEILFVRARSILTARSFLRLGY